MNLINFYIELLKIFCNVTFDKKSGLNPCCV